VVRALRIRLSDTSCTEDERRAVERFLDLVSQELRGEA
jgi:hypothetical protein